MSATVEFIAEIDEAGHVLWVWHKPPGARRSHPVKDFAGAKNQLDTATCHGASCAAIRGWIEARAEQAESAAPGA